MNMITRVEDWGNSHRPGWLDIFRVILGCYITYKGFDFLNHIEDLEMTIQGVNMAYAAVSMAHYVVFAHVLCGPLIALGLLTRIMCLVQIPILLGAVFWVNAPKGYMSLGNHMELEISLVVLLGLIVFMVFRAGKFSIDEKRRKEKAIEMDKMAH
ncbi:MAG TPA: DoxX family protein [Cytophagales bacterium]|nr:DoxX family protein [Cytophagales bacterium]